MPGGRPRPATSLPAPRSSPFARFGPPPPGFKVVGVRGGRREADRPPGEGPLRPPSVRDPERERGTGDGHVSPAASGSWWRRSLVGVPLLAGPAGAAQLDGEPGIEASPDTAWTASVAATLPPGTVRVQVLRDGRRSTTWRPREAWRTPTICCGRGRRTVRGPGARRERGGPLLDDHIGHHPSPAGSFPRLYDDASFWNTQVGPSPALDPARRRWWPPP